MINFLTTPRIGTVLHLDGQAYELREVRPHVRRDGAPSKVLVWESLCPSCGAAFQVTSGLRSKALNRRCSGCAKVGRPVSRKRGRPVAVRVVKP